MKEVAIVGSTQVFSVDTIKTNGVPVRYSGRYVVPSKWVIYTSDTYYNRVYHDGVFFVVRIGKQWRQVFMTELKEKV